MGEKLEQAAGELLEKTTGKLLAWRVGRGVGEEKIGVDSIHPK